MQVKKDLVAFEVVMASLQLRQDDSLAQLNFFGSCWEQCARECGRTSTCRTRSPRKVGNDKFCFSRLELSLRLKHQRFLHKATLYCKDGRHGN